MNNCIIVLKFSLYFFISLSLISCIKTKSNQTIEYCTDSVLFNNLKIDLDSAKYSIKKNVYNDSLIIRIDLNYAVKFKVQPYFIDKKLKFVVLKSEKNVNQWKMEKIKKIYEKKYGSSIGEYIYGKYGFIKFHFKWKDFLDKTIENLYIIYGDKTLKLKKDSCEQANDEKLIKRKMNEVNNTMKII